MDPNPNPPPAPTPSPTLSSAAPPASPPSLVVTLLILIAPALLATLFGIGAVRLKGDDWLVPFLLIACLGSLVGGTVAGVRLSARFARGGSTHPLVAVVCLFGCIGASFVACFVGCVGSAITAGNL